MMEQELHITVEDLILFDNVGTIKFTRKFPFDGETKFNRKLGELDFTVHGSRTFYVKAHLYTESLDEEIAEKKLNHLISEGVLNRAVKQAVYPN